MVTEFVLWMNVITQGIFSRVANYVFLFLSSLDGNSRDKNCQGNILLPIHQKKEIKKGKKKVPLDEVLSSQLCLSCSLGHLLNVPQSREVLSRIALNVGHF